MKCLVCEGKSVGEFGDFVRVEFHDSRGRGIIFITYFVDCRADLRYLGWLSAFLRANFGNFRIPVDPLASGCPLNAQETN